MPPLHRPAGAQERELSRIRRGIRATFGPDAVESEDASLEEVTGMHPTDNVDMAMGYVD